MIYKISFETTRRLAAVADAKDISQIIRSLDETDLVAKCEAWMAKHSHFLIVVISVVIEDHGKVSAIGSRRTKETCGYQELDREPGM